MKNSDSTPQSAAASSLPEFADHRTARALFGLSRSYLYKLAEERKIRSVSIRKPGAIRGRRLFNCASIRAFIESAEAQA
jgi:hypothetical protein